MTTRTPQLRYSLRTMLLGMALLGVLLLLVRVVFFRPKVALEITSKKVNTVYLDGVCLGETPIQCSSPGLSDTCGTDFTPQMPGR